MVVVRVATLSSVLLWRKSRLKAKDSWCHFTSPLWHLLVLTGQAKPEFSHVAPFGDTIPLVQLF